MSKLFMYGTHLQGLEQMMMSVPNFTPRTKQKKKVNDLHHIKPNDMSYERAVRDSYKHIRNYRFNVRIEELIRNFDGNIFIDHTHKSRFYDALMKQDISLESMTPENLSTLFLLTTDEELWGLVKDKIDLHRCKLEKMKLRGLNIEAYALYQAARTVKLAREKIKVHEIADEEVVADDTFKAIVHGTLLFKYGAKVLKAKWTCR